MRGRALFFFASFFALCWTAPCLAEWQLVRDDEGIVVESETLPGQSLPRLRAVVRIDRPVEEVLGVITDVSGQTKWMYRCTDARRLGEDANGVLLYNRTAPHWAISDRDVVLRRTLSRSPEDGSAQIEFHATQELDFVPDASVVRMPRLDGHYDLRPHSEGGTRVEYQLEIDPGGAIPDWLVSRTTVNLPWFTLRNLRARVEDIARAEAPPR